jgi:16S rRNA (adenine(1408)-N(1))-methyltransferase
VRRAARDPAELVVAVDASAAALGAGFSQAARRRLHNVLFVLAAAEDLPEELDGSADEVRVQFPWGSLLRLVLDAGVGTGTDLLGRIATILKPGGRLVLALSIVPRDGVAELAELDEPGARALLARIERRGDFAGGHVVPINAAVTRTLHSTWASRLRVGHERPGWLIETTCQARASQPRATEARATEPAVTESPVVELPEGGVRTSGAARRGCQPDR